MSSSEIATTSSDDNYTSYKRVTKKDAFSLFGEMRYSTEEETQLYNQMLENISLSLNINIFDL